MQTSVVSFEPYTDTYFLRSLEILKKEELNPYVRAQIFFRGEPGKLCGVGEAVAMIKQTDLAKNGGHVFTLSEGDSYEPLETVMLLEGHIQDIVILETVILGILSAETTKKNDHHGVDLLSVTKTVKDIVSKTERRPVLYMGARHWRYDEDAAIATAAFDGGASDGSTDMGTKGIGKKGVGTIPHSLECIFAWKYRMDKAVLETLTAFDRHIDQKVPRIALIDFNNKEIDDSLVAAHTLKDRLFALRIDTAGENRMQNEKVFDNHKDDPYWSGKGVTVGGVYAVRRTLDQHGFEDVKIVLTSGFGDPEKVKTFVEAEKELGIRLFDVLGVGKVFPVRAATMDVVGVGETSDTLQPISKVGREYRPNKRLQQVM